MRKFMMFLKRPSIGYFVASVVILTVCSILLEQLLVLRAGGSSNMVMYSRLWSG